MEWRQCCGYQKGRATRQVAQDIRQHPYKYAFYGVEAAAALTPLPEAYAAYEGVKAGADVAVGAAHLAWDLAQ